jgi:hypothetical protein
MAKHTITSKKTGNVVEVEYNDDGVLCAVFYHAPITDIAVQWMQQYIPIREPQLMQFYPDRFRIEVVLDEVSFEAFWNAYAEKRGRQNAEKQWSKLTMSERGAAIRNIKKYKAYCAQISRHVKDPERYLSQKTFNDEFKVN